MCVAQSSLQSEALTVAAAQGESDQMQKAQSTSSVKSVTSRASVRSKSGSKASLKEEMEGNINVQKDPSKASVKSVASKTSVRSNSGSKASLKEEENVAQEVHKVLNREHSTLLMSVVVSL